MIKVHIGILWFLPIPLGCYTRHVLIAWPSRRQCIVLTDMMTSSNGNTFRVTGPLWGEYTYYRWNSLTKARDVEYSCFRRSAPEQAVEQTIETPVIWSAIALIMTSLQGSPEIGQCKTHKQINYLCPCIRQNFSWNVSILFIHLSPWCTCFVCVQPLSCWCQPIILPVH